VCAQLRAVVIGAGLAGEGHTVALQDAGVRVQAICSRTPEVVSELVARLGIEQASTDWRRTLETERPDIVAVATPAAAHVEQITAALHLGCHVYADKPLAVTARDARELYSQALKRGVKTALATTWMYDPGVTYLRELVAAGAVGRPLEVESRHLLLWPYPVAATWMNRLGEGGGLLNNRFPHQLAAAQRVVGGEVLQAMGEARLYRSRLPNVGHLHDYRQRRILRPEELVDVSWEEVDGDDACTVLLRLGEPGPDSRDTVVGHIYCSAVIRPREERTLTIYGDGGSLHYAGGVHFGSRPNSAARPTISRVTLQSTDWVNEPVPDRIFKALPAIANDLQRDWAALAREFVADIRGEPHSTYPTFRQGWINQEIIEVARNRSGWRDIPHDIVPDAGNA
jgi:predicted dehydrogenase